MTSITLPASVDSIGAATRFADERLTAAGCPPRVRAMIDVAIDELLSNIARYAYPEGGGTMTLSAEVQAGRAVLTFRDGGMPYDPLTGSEPDTQAALQDRPIGGLGVFLVRRTMDAVRYERQQDQNVLTVEKSWPV